MEYFRPAAHGSYFPPRQGLTSRKRPGKRNNLRYKEAENFFENVDWGLGKDLRIIG